MSRLIDITGQKFYEWTVIGKAKPAKNGNTMWNCVCSCGETRVVRGYDLKRGKHKSCGHISNITIKDIKGQLFGELTALEYLGESKWKCKCSCGRVVEVRGYDLTTGHTKSCGHSTTGFKDLKGEVFGEWEVLEYLGNSLWKCKCSCGEISEVHSYSLRNGGSKSCGNHTISSKLENLEGKQFNEWTALRYLGNSTWECKCSCGKVSRVSAYDLKQGNSRNCGHNRKTPYKDLTGMKFGELTVIKYLYKNRYLCECSCGTQKEVMGINMLSGSTVSCGCKHSTIYTEEMLRKTIEYYKKQFGEEPFATDIAELLGITYYYTNSLLNKYDLKHLMNNSFGSRYEKDIYNIIKESNNTIDIKTRDRKTLGNGQELDIYIPSKRLAIEFNGDYWHNADRLGSKYHQQKTIECAKKGIQLIHIFEHEWLDNNTHKKILKLIESKVDNSRLNKIYARKCEIRQVDIQTEREFINKYHIQNYVSSRVAYGIYLDKEIISIMTFGSPRFGNKAEWELLRYCTKDDIVIVGGAEKLFKHFIKNNKPTSVVSYCDISKFNGKVYTKLGFKVTAEDITSPNYKWLKYNSNSIDVLTRYQTQKNRLLELGYGNYGKTEDEIMNNLGYIKIYDSGNLRFIWRSN